MYKWFLCLRYLRKRRIAFFGIAAVMLCVALLIVITSLFSGFIDRYLEYSDRIWGEIVLEPYQEMAGYEELARHLEELPAVAAAEPVLQISGLLYIGTGDVRGVQLVGIDLAKHSRDPVFRNGLLLQNGPGSPRFDLSESARKQAGEWLRSRLSRDIEEADLPVGAILSIGILGSPNDQTDEYDRQAIMDQIQNGLPLVITAGIRSRGEGETARKIQGRCWAVDAVQIGLYEADSAYVYLPFAYLQGWTGQTGPDGKKQCLASVQIRRAPGFGPETVKQQVREAWKQFVKTNLGWPEQAARNVAIYSSGENEMVKIFTHEIRKQLGVMQMMMGLICLVTALLVFVTLFMIVTQKRRDMGIIRGLGGSRRGLAVLFLYYGLSIGVVGTALGLFLGVLATRNINLLEAALTRLLGFKVWKSGVYMFSHIPDEVAWNSVGWILAAGVGTAVLGAALPAWRAARLHPVENLRYE